MLSHVVSKCPCFSVYVNVILDKSFMIRDLSQWLSDSDITPCPLMTRDH